MPSNAYLHTFVIHNKSQIIVTKNSSLRRIILAAMTILWVVFSFRTELDEKISQDILLTVYNIYWLYSYINPHSLYSHTQRQGTAILFSLPCKRVRHFVAHITKEREQESFF